MNSEKVMNTLDLSFYLFYQMQPINASRALEFRVVVPREIFLPSYLLYSRDRVRYLDKSISPLSNALIWLRARPRKIVGVKFVEEKP